MQRLLVTLGIVLGTVLAGALLALAWPDQQPPGESREAADTNGSSQSHLKQLGVALLMYAQDYNEMLPPMKDAAAVKRLLLPYVRGNEAVFVHPQTGEPYRPNPSLSGRRRSSIAMVSGRDSRGKAIRPRRHRAEIPGSPAQVVAFYEASPAPDGTRAVLFLDGHVGVIRETEWPRLKRASKIP
jgi:prepilin-type processing-associated H-X9-DG protein